MSKKYSNAHPRAGIFTGNYTQTGRKIYKTKKGEDDCPLFLKYAPSPGAFVPTILPSTPV